MLQTARLTEAVLKELEASVREGKISEARALLALRMARRIEGSTDTARLGPLIKQLDDLLREIEAPSVTGTQGRETKLHVLQGKHAARITGPPGAKRAKVS
jgi:hypothetical protein